VKITNYKKILSKQKNSYLNHYENSIEIIYEFDEDGIITSFRKTGKLFLGHDRSELF
jgi:hypothetical protein